MASVSIEFEAFGDPRFTILGQLIRKDKFSVLARCAAVWKFCIQRNTHILSKKQVDVLGEKKGFADAMIEAELAESTEDDGMIRISGTQGRIEYLAEAKERQRVATEAAKKKREEEATKRSHADGPNIGSKQSSYQAPTSVSNGDPTLESNVGSILESRRESSPDPTLESSSTSASASTSYKRKRETEKLSPTELNVCIEEWGKTLSLHKIKKDPRFDEANIARLILRHGFEKTRFALLGAGFEGRSADYDPSKYVNILRLEDSKNFENFVNLGCQHQPAAARQYVQADAVC